MIGGYCPLCNPSQEQEEKRISESRKDLARSLHMLGERPSPEEIEREIFRERELVINMSDEEIGNHIDELDAIYEALQKQVKATKVKLIAGLEVKRARNVKTKKKTKEEKEAIKDEQSVNDMLLAVAASIQKKKEEGNKTILE